MSSWRQGAESSLHPSLRPQNVPSIPPCRPHHRESAIVLLPSRLHEGHPNRDTVRLPHTHNFSRGQLLASEAQGDGRPRHRTNEERDPRARHRSPRWTSALAVRAPRLGHRRRAAPRPPQPPGRGRRSGTSQRTERLPTRLGCGLSPAPPRSPRAPQRERLLITDTTHGRSVLLHIKHYF